MLHVELYLLPSEIGTTYLSLDVFMGLHLVKRQAFISKLSACKHELACYTALPLGEKAGLVPFKPVIYEFIQTCQIALSKRLSHLKILMATHLVWQTGKPKCNPFILQLNHYNGNSALTLGRDC